MTKKKVLTPEDRLRVSEIKPEPEVIEFPNPEPEERPEPEEKPEPEPEEKPEPEEQPEPEEKPEEVEEVETPETGVSSDSIDELINKIGSAEAPKTGKKLPEEPLVSRTRKKKRKGQSDPDSFRIEGYVLMLITDTVFPFAFAGVNNLLDKRHKIEAHQLSLDDKDFEKLSPLADQAADYMSINLNPIAGFLLISSFMYGNNLLNLRMKLTEK